MGTIEDAVVGTIHMHLKKGTSKVEIVEMIEKEFLEGEVHAGLVKVAEVLELIAPTGRKDTPARSAAAAYAQDMYDIIAKTDNEGTMPKVVVCSEMLNRIKS